MTPSAHIDERTSMLPKAKSATANGLTRGLRMKPEYAGWTRRACWYLTKVSYVIESTTMNRHYRASRIKPMTKITTASA